MPGAFSSDGPLEGATFATLIVAAVRSLRVLRLLRLSSSSAFGCFLFPNCTGKVRDVSSYYSYYVLLALFAVNMASATSDHLKLRGRVF